MQNQHFNMAAIVARYWRYNQEIPIGDDERSRHAEVCLFDTEKFFSFTKDERKKYPGKNFFDLINDENFRKNKIEKCISTSSLEDNNRNRRIDGIFTSLLITDETENQLGANNIETNFLNLLKKFDSEYKSEEQFLNEVYFQPETGNIIKNFIVLQFVRSPILYKFFLNNYFFTQHQNNINNPQLFNKRVNEGNSVFFEDYSLLDSYRAEKFLDYANAELILNFKEMDDIFNHYQFTFLPVRNVYLGNLTTFFLDFERFGIAEKEIIKMIGNDVNHREIFSKIVYCPVSSNMCIIGVPKEKVENKEFDPVLPILEQFLKNGYQNSIQLLYSKHIVIPPSHREQFIRYFNIMLLTNDAKMLYEDREKNHAYIDGLEQMLERLKNYKKLFD